jgi:hypothetical protein
MTAQGNLGRLALVICLLTICIETLERSHHQVISQIYTGMNLFEEWMSSASENPQNLLGLSSPKHYLVEAEIIQEFQNFSAEASALFDPRPRGYHQKLQCEGFEALQSMPHIFTNTQEARLYLDLITRRTHHFITSIRPDKTGHTNQQHDSSAPGLNTGFDTLQLFTELPEHLQLEQEIYAHEIRRWSASFTPLTSDRDLLTQTPQAPLQHPRNPLIRRSQL